MWLVELYLVKHGQKLLQRHVGGYGVGLAVAAAVEAAYTPKTVGARDEEALGAHASNKLSHGLFVAVGS